jgi:uncharacterized membrane protein
MKKEPPHFTWEDFTRAFLGSFIFAVTFLFSGLLITIAKGMSQENVVMVVLLTCISLTMEIYFLSYRYVYDRKHRPFLEFWGKRFFSIIISSLISVMVLVFVYGISNMLSSDLEIFKVCVAAMLPATTAGGAMEILKKKFF